MTLRAAGRGQKRWRPLSHSFRPLSRDSAVDGISTRSETNQKRDGPRRAPPLPPRVGGVASLLDRTHADAPPYPAQEEGCAVNPLPPAAAPGSLGAPPPSAIGGTLDEPLECRPPPPPLTAWGSACTSGGQPGSKSSPDDISVSIDASDARFSQLALLLLLLLPLPFGHGRCIRDPDPAKIGLTTHARSEIGGARRVGGGSESVLVTTASCPTSSSTSGPV